MSRLSTIPVAHELNTELSSDRLRLKTSSIQREMQIGKIIFMIFVVDGIPAYRIEFVTTAYRIAQIQLHILRNLICVNAESVLRQIVHDSRCVFSAFDSSRFFRASTAKCRLIL